MSGERATPPQRPGLSLYANLLEDAPGTISGAPVTYNKPSEAGADQDEAAKKQQALAASLRFQPTKRPQLAAQKANAKAKAIASKLAQQVSSSSSAAAAVTAQPAETTKSPPDGSTRDGSMTATAATAHTAGPKLTAADWAATLSEDEDVNAYYASTRQKRKKRKKNKEAVEVQQDWDDIYDPSRPNNYEEYKNSEEKIREVREWKDLLYRHRMSRRKSSDYDSDRSEPRPMMNKRFAPPPSMSFAPPTSFDEDDKDGHDYDNKREDGDDDDENYVPPPPPDPATFNVDASGEDAYLRRLRMSQPGAQQTPPPPPSPPPPPPPPVVEPVAPPPGQIARAPVRYNLPPPPPEIPASEAELEAKLEVESESQSLNPPEDDDDGDRAQQARSNRPGQAGFAERLMAKYGWTKGSGLGATGSGITNALYVKADKRKKKSDAEGGGFATPATMGKILGGKRAKKETDGEGADSGGGGGSSDGKFGAMSEVIRLSNMLKGLDVQAELSRQEDVSGGLMQEIGEECSDKYGSVERVFIHHQQTVKSSQNGNDNKNNDDEQEEEEAVVFVKFISPLSALRAVNALEGRIFNGNEIRARFWDTEKFEGGVFE